MCIVERGSSAVECPTHNRESSGSNPPFAAVLKLGHFRSLHDAPVHSFGKSVFSSTGIVANILFSMWRDL